MAFANIDIAVRTVLVEKIQSSFPLRKLESVKKSWKEGHHPSCCIGNCKIKSGVFGEYCDKCGWMDF